MRDSESLAVPTPQQLAWQRERPFALFCHFGINLRTRAVASTSGDVACRTGGSLVSVDAQLTGVEAIPELDPQRGMLAGKMGDRR